MVEMSFRQSPNSHAPLAEDWAILETYRGSELSL